MIIKGSARGGAKELATHLLRQDTNERVTVLAMSGVASLDLHGALAELDYMGAGSRSERRLYHASVNTPSHEPLNFAEQHRARERLAAEFGLTEQPYVMVEHIKHGRQHLHIVWSRVDVETGKAISDSHNYRRHEIVSRELALEFGRTPVAGVHIRDKEHEPRPARGPTWSEQLQAERSGMPAAEIKQIVTALWRSTSTGQDFMHRLECERFILAKGNKRDFVLIDKAGEIHSLTRKINGARAAEVRQRMSDIDPTNLPSVEEAREKQRQLKPEPVMEKGFVSPSERIRLEERQREKEGKKGPREQLSGTHGEIADAIYHLNKTMRHQMADTVANSQTHLGREAFQQETTRAPEQQPSVAMRKAALELQREQNRIQPVRDEETAQQKSMEAVAKRIQNNFAQAKARDERKARESAASPTLREASGLPRGSGASPQAIERLDKELGRMSRNERQDARKEALEPVHKSDPKEEFKWKRSRGRSGPDLGR